MQITEIPFADPMEVLRKLATLRRPAFLDSAMEHVTLGRFSYVTADPFGEFRVAGGIAHWNGEPVQGPPLEALDDVLARFPEQTVPGPAPFPGGAIGFLAYDFSRALERLPPPEFEPADLPQILLNLYDTVISFDHVTKRAWIVSTGRPQTEPDAIAKRAAERTAFFQALLRRPLPMLRGSGAANLAWHSNFTAETYADAVTRVIEFIRAGDIFEANIAQRFSADLPADFDPLAFYDRLRRANPATFAAYLDLGDVVVASSSPERFLKVAAGEVETRPIKGTARRHADAAADAASAAALVASEKDRAENVMIVDLLRNDLSRVCLDESVDVPVLCGLETYASVHHLVSVVTGRLAPGRSLGDLLAASFPGGSITGAPKIRAMEIITEIERHARGIYCGSIGWIGFDGAMDLNIAIRTVVIAQGEAVVHAGGAVTLASDPDGEYQETLVKAERVLAAFRPDGEGRP
jgi:para-aminobenzoate synthetase component I